MIANFYRGGFSSSCFWCSLKGDSTLSCRCYVDKAKSGLTYNSELDLSTFTPLFPLFSSSFSFFQYLLTVCRRLCPQLQRPAQVPPLERRDRLLRPQHVLRPGQGINQHPHINHFLCLFSFFTSFSSFILFHLLSYIDIYLDNSYRLDFLVVLTFFSSVRSLLPSCLPVVLLLVCP